MEDEKLTYRVITEVNRSRMEIQQALCIYEGDNLIQRGMAEVMKLREQGLREALIKLGWTPPKENQWKTSAWGEYWDEYQCQDCGRKVVCDAEDLIRIEDYRCEGVDKPLVDQTEK